MKQENFIHDIFVLLDLRKFGIEMTLPIIWVVKMIRTKIEQPFNELQGTAYN